MNRTVMTSPESHIDTSVLQDVAQSVRVTVDDEVSRFYGRLAPTDVGWKDDNQPVTPADLNIERKLIASLNRILPGGVVAEESGNQDAWRPGAVTWIIDPIDGSDEFIQGSAEFATTVALWASGRIEAAWIYAPVKAQMWSAQHGQGWRLNGEPAYPRGRRTQISVTADQYITKHLQAVATRLRAAGEQIVPCRTVSLAYTELATGRLDAAIYDWDKPWDHAAGVLLCSEARLRARHVSGQRYDPSQPWPATLLIAPHDRWDALAHLAR